MKLGMLVPRAVMILLSAGACWWLTSALGPWKAVGLWASGMAIVCVGTAAWLHHQSPERITFVNRLAGYVLPWGYHFGRGKLIPIVVTSWIVWVLLGIGAAIAFERRGAPEPVPPPGAASEDDTLLTVLLYLAWIVDGAVLLRLVGVSWDRRSRVPGSVLVVALVIVAILVGSVVIKVSARSAGATSAALWVAGGPLLVVGVGYGVFLAVVLTFGRHTRWN